MNSPIVSTEKIREEFEVLVSRLFPTWRRPAPIERSRAAHASGRSLFAGVSIIAGYAGTLLFAIVLLTRYGGVVKDAGWVWQISRSGAVVESVDPLGPAAGLPTGARLLAINGDSRASSRGPRPWLQTVHPGQMYSVSWQAAADSSPRHSAFVMGSHRSPRDLWMGICDLFLSLSFFAGGLLVWRAKPASNVTRAGYIAAFLTALYLVGSALGPLSPLLSGPPLALYFLLKSLAPFWATAACVFFAIFPAGAALGPRLRLCLRVLGAGALLVWVIMLPARLLPLLGLSWRLSILSGLDLTTRPELGMVPLRHGYYALCGAFIFAIAIRNYRVITDAALRLRVRWVILGTTIGVLPAVITSLVMSQASLTRGGQNLTSTLILYYSLPTLTLAALPMTVAYAVICHRLMGIRVALLSGVQVLAARRALQALTLLPAILLCAYLGLYDFPSIRNSFSRHPEISIAIALAASIAFFRKELLDAADKILLRLPHDRDKVLRSLLHSLLQQHSTAAVSRLAASCLTQLLRPDALIIFCEGDDGPPLGLVHTGEDDGAPDSLDVDSPLLRLLAANGTTFLNRNVFEQLPRPDREWLSRSGIAVAVPVHADVRTEPAGVLFLGRKRSLESYTASDVDIMNDVSRQVYLALKLRETERSLNLAERACRQAETLLDSLEPGPAHPRRRAGSRLAQKKVIEIQAETSGAKVAPPDRRNPADSAAEQGHSGEDRSDPF